MIWLPVIACVLHLRLSMTIVVAERRARSLYIPIFATLVQNIVKKIFFTFCLLVVGQGGRSIIGIENEKSPNVDSAFTSTQKNLADL